MALLQQGGKEGERERERREGGRERRRGRRRSDSQPPEKIHTPFSLCSSGHAIRERLATTSGCGSTQEHRQRWKEREGQRERGEEGQGEREREREGKEAEEWVLYFLKRY